MGGNRTLVIVLALILVMVVIFGGFLLLRGGLGTSKTPTDDEATPTPLVEYTNIVVAVQNIPRGMTIRQENMAIELQEWPNDHLPVAYYTDISQVEGKMARTDIPLGIPVMPDMIAKSGDTLAADGSAASLFGPNDRVAYAIPIDLQGGVAWAIRPGDHVDVIAAIKLMMVDTEFQSQYPNEYISLPQSKEDPILTGIYGRFETLPNGQPAMIYPTGELQPNLVVQLMVQDAVVWKLGVWPLEEQEAAIQAAAGATPAAAGAAGAAGTNLAGTSPTPTPKPVSVVEITDVAPVTLLVKREESLVLKYLYEIGADIDLVLRPAGFTEPVMQTQPVWLRYVIDKYQLPDTPPDLPIVPIIVRTPIVLKIATPTPAKE
ncbi:MAG: hypothetical protein JXA21_16090 [Anaerolineae bacterium]|nr:hypothetical protein [Anaerolineae bacterium]